MGQFELKTPMDIGLEFQTDSLPKNQKTPTRLDFVRRGYQQTTSITAFPSSTVNVCRESCQVDAATNGTVRRQHYIAVNAED